MPSSQDYVLLGFEAVYIGTRVPIFRDSGMNLSSEKEWNEVKRRV
jgi:hypothetical protein